MKKKEELKKLKDDAKRKIKEEKFEKRRQELDDAMNRSDRLEQDEVKNMTKNFYEKLVEFMMQTISKRNPVTTDDEGKESSSEENMGGEPSRSIMDSPLPSLEGA